MLWLGCKMLKDVFFVNSLRLEFGVETYFDNKHSWRVTTVSTVSTGNRCKHCFFLKSREGKQRPEDTLTSLARIRIHSKQCHPHNAPWFPPLRIRQSNKTKMMENNLGTGSRRITAVCSPTTPEACHSQYSHLKYPEATIILLKLMNRSFMVL